MSYKVVTQIIGDDADPGDAAGDINLWRTTDLSENAVQVSGLWIVRYGDPAGAYAGVFEGADITAAVPVGNAQNFTNAFGGVRGVAGAVVHGGSGVITQAEGVGAWVNQTGTGDITDVALFHALNAGSPGAGAITGVQYGLRIDDLTTGTFNVGIQIDGATTFGIWVQGGTVRLDDLLQIFGAYAEFTEQPDPAAPPANNARFYARDNGGGKTQIVVRFPTGAIQVIATEP